MTLGNTVVDVPFIAVSRCIYTKGEPSPFTLATTTRESSLWSVISLECELDSYSEQHIRNNIFLYGFGSRVSASVEYK